MGTVYPPPFLLSHHSSNPLQVPSDDSLNAAYVSQLRPLLNAEKARAAQGLPPRTSSTPSAHVSLSDEDADRDGAGDVTFRPYEDQLDGAVENDAEENTYMQPDDTGDDCLFDDPRFDDATGEEAAQLADDYNEENSIMLRDPEDRAQVESEMRDLESAVPQILRDYRLLDRLGEGTFSSVYKALDITQEQYNHRVWRPPAPQPTKVFVALKRIYVTSSPQRIANEISILQACRDCRNVSKLLTAFRYRDQVVAVMPYVANQDFREIFMNLSLSSTKAYFRCMFRALCDLHALGMVHRDVKPANFLFNPILNVGTLCDFGLAQKIENETPSNSCLHTPGTREHPHGKHRVLKDYQRTRITEKTNEARRRSAMPSEKIGIPAEDTRPSMKANRAGTRGFRAPEVLFKCPDQSVALDVWSAGTILLCILACKFPIFTASDDIEALMELAAVYGRRTMEKCGKLHNRTFATNVPSVEHDEMPWSELVNRINPHLYQFDSSLSASSSSSSISSLAPHADSKSQRAARGAAAAAPTASSSRPTRPLPSSHRSRSQQQQYASSLPPSSSQPQALDRPIPPTKHNLLVDEAIDLMSQCLHWDPTRRITAAEALNHPFLYQPDEPEPEGEGDDADAEGERDPDEDVMYEEVWRGGRYVYAPVEGRRR